jgi:hypothetical protein
MQDAKAFEAEAPDRSELGPAAKPLGPAAHLRGDVGPRRLDPHRALARISAWA